MAEPGAVRQALCGLLATRLHRTGRLPRYFGNAAAFLLLLCTAAWKPAVYGIWPGRLPKTFPVWKPAVYGAPFTGGKQRSLRENAQPVVQLFKHEADASLPTDTQARFPAAGTVLELQQTLDLHSVLYTLVWEQRAQQVETTPDGKPAGPTFSLGSFEARDELLWSYTNGDSNWCPQARKTQVHYSVHPAQTTYRLDKVEEPEPCSFTFYVSGP
ncbi:hypothetical protein N2152v2_004542 [Parachlorella kessleri]